MRFWGCWLRPGDVWSKLCSAVRVLTGGRGPPAAETLEGKPNCVRLSPHPASLETAPESPSQGEVGLERSPPPWGWGRHSPAWLLCSADCDSAPGLWGTLGARVQTLSPRDRHCLRALLPPHWLQTVHSAHLQWKQCPASAPHLPTRLQGPHHSTLHRFAKAPCPIPLHAASELCLSVHFPPGPVLAASRSLNTRAVFNELCGPHCLVLYLTCKCSKCLKTTEPN